MRVYVPLTLPALQQAYGAGELAPAPLDAYAVTPGLAEWCASDNDEELEYAALGQAARASLRLLAVDAGAPRRRVVLAVEAPDRAVSVPHGQAPDDESLGGATLQDAVPMAKVAAVHVDAEDAARDVASAVASLEAAGRGDDGAQAAVDGAEDHELLWFATQEIPALVG